MRIIATICLFLLLFSWRLILSRWILLSFILKLVETFSISEFKLNSEVRAATKNHLSIQFE